MPASTRSVAFIDAIEVLCRRAAHGIILHMHYGNEADHGARPPGGSQIPNFAIVELHSDDDLAAHLHKPGRRKATDFLCLDGRKVGLDSVLIALEGIVAYEVEHLDGFLPPRVVIAECGSVSPENLEKIARSGAYLFETPNGCDAVDLAKQRLAELFAPISAAITTGHPPQRGPQPPQVGCPSNAPGELSVYTSWPEALDAGALADLYRRSATPDSPLKDD